MEHPFTAPPSEWHAIKRAWRTDHMEVRALYLAMLEALPLEIVRAFWARQRLNDDAASEIDTLRALWRHESSIDVATFELVVGDVERFLAELGIPIERVVTDALFRFRSGILWSPEQMLRALRGTLPLLHDATEPARAVHEVQIRFVRELQGGLWAGMLGERMTETFYEFVFAAAEPGLRVPLCFNAVLWGAPGLCAFPTLFGFPPAHGFSLRAEGRSPSDVLWSGELVRRGDALLLDGEPIGRFVRWRAFCEEHGWRSAELPEVDGDVLWCERDVACPDRKRVVLHAGVVYGAPLAVGVVRQARAPRPLPEDYLDGLWRHLVSQQTEEYQKLTARHDELVRLVERRLRVDYERERDALRVDGRVLCSGMAARLLYRALQRLDGALEREFAFLDFKYDAFVTRNPKNSGFETVLGRLTDALGVEDWGIRVMRSRRGHFRISVAAPVTMAEAPR